MAAGGIVTLLALLMVGGQDNNTGAASAPLGGETPGVESSESVLRKRKPGERLETRLETRLDTRITKERLEKAGVISEQTRPGRVRLDRVKPAKTAK